MQILWGTVTRTIPVYHGKFSMRYHTRAAVASDFYSCATYLGTSRYHGGTVLNFVHVLKVKINNK